MLNWHSMERYLMLSKHRKSAQTVLGTGVCALIGVFSLASAPVSIAQTGQDSAYDPSSDPEDRRMLAQSITRSDESIWFCSQSGRIRVSCSYE